MSIGADGDRVGEVMTPEVKRVEVRKSGRGRVCTDMTCTTGASFSSSNPTSQCALKGHIIVFPAKPEALSPFLPPALEDVITLMCIVFVGSIPPTKEWLKANARPLIVRCEKVHHALEWLVANNPLYHDVILHKGHLNQIPSHDVAVVRQQPMTHQQAHMTRM
ncbi:uncharacterized protein EI90DRAFT_3139845 [Cantharellus anzutake]|uniref:uncharacterized protein n=1 Tax=Cantharellus anzutake TaxID=1750568 RepID=UPI001906EEE2|nr:uncharacterized protein EI90DRAFT_3139845 [Cantharellus anzutake]KAF8310227.1 hypothetical protein EI90DRAFT_3139845 [Cantharellus anzutake]